MRCLQRGDESEEESDGGRGEAPAHCVFAEASARQLARGPDSVVSLCRLVYGGAVALQRQVLHGGGLLDVMRSIFLDFLSTWIMFRRRLPRQDKVGSRGNSAFRGSAALSVYPC